MLYDWQGFPVHTHDVSYSADGARGLARGASALIETAGLPCTTEIEGGFDLGAFVLLSVIYPEADVPVFKLSLDDGLDSQAYLRLGRALMLFARRKRAARRQRHELSRHRAESSTAKAASKAFDDRLSGALQQSTGAERADRVAHWAMHPARGWHIRAGSICCH